jgi:transcriptional repressor NrdR
MKVRNIMICPECGFNDSKVIDSRPAETKIRRRRECLECSGRFTTYEIIEDIPIMVVKKDSTIEPFDSRKLIERMLRATTKRPVKLKTIENVVESIQMHFKNNFQREVTSDKIGEIVMRRLKEIDHVAYVRFASVYREFDDIDSFVKIISELQSEDV